MLNTVLVSKHLSERRCFKCWNTRKWSNLICCVGHDCVHWCWI